MVTLDEQIIIDTCSGVGGFTLGAMISGGFRTVLFSEINQHCQQVLRLRFSDIPIIPDVKDVTAKSLLEHGITRVDGVVGGFPCQPHSQSGKKKGSEDERDLWPEMRRILCELRPTWAVFENVPGLLSSEAGQFFRGILWDLASLGFNVEWGTVPCAYLETSEGAIGVGGVHLRERVWIIAIAKSGGTNDLYGQANAIGNKNWGKKPGKRDRGDNTVSTSHSNGERCSSSRGLERKDPNLLHQQWNASENQQPRGRRQCGTESIRDAATNSDRGQRGLVYGQRKNLQARANSALVGSSSKLAEFTTRGQTYIESAFRSHDDGIPSRLDGYLLTQPRLEEWLIASTIPSFDRLSRCEIEQLSPKDRAEYKTLYTEYQRLRKQHKEELKALGNSIVPQVAALIFDVLKERLTERLKGAS